MKIVVVIPAYNEEETVGTVIHDVTREMTKLGQDYDIILVDDGSTDTTADVARRAGATVHSNQCNFGLAETFRVAMQKALAAKADVVVHMDADGQHQATDIIKLVRPVLAGECDLALGARLPSRSMALINKIGNRLLSRVVSGITKVKITDSQTGFRAFTKELAERVGTTTDHTYTQEQIIRAVKCRFRVREVPIHATQRGHGKSKVASSISKYAVNTGIGLLRIYRDYQPLRFFGSIGLSLILASLGTGIYTFVAHGTILDTTVMILFLTGAQIVLFGFLADMVRVKG